MFKSIDSLFFRPKTKFNMAWNCSLIPLVCHKEPKTRRRSEAKVSPRSRWHPHRRPRNCLITVCGTSVASTNWVVPASKVRAGAGQSFISAGARRGRRCSSGPSAGSRIWRAASRCRDRAARCATCRTRCSSWACGAARARWPPTGASSPPPGLSCAAAPASFVPSERPFRRSCELANLKRQIKENEYFFLISTLYFSFLIRDLNFGNM